MDHQASHNMDVSAWMRWWVIGCCGLDAALRLTVVILKLGHYPSGSTLWIIPVGASLLAIGMLLRYGSTIMRTTLVILLIPILVMVILSVTLWGFTGARLLPLLLILRPICILIAVWLAWSNTHTTQSGWISIIVGTIAICISIYLTLLGMPW